MFKAGGFTNKNTSYIIIAFLIGIIATQYFLSAKNVDKPLVNLEEPETVNTPNQIKHSPQKMQKLGQTVRITLVPNDQPVGNAIKAEHSLAAMTQKNTEALNTTSEPIQIKKRRIVELTLDAQNIANLERNINDLSLKVVMHKEDRGWRVEYLFPENPMANIGLANNDLVLYDLLQSARENPKTAQLTSRLENVFATLVR